MNEKLTIQVTKFTLMTLKNSALAYHKTPCDYIIGTSGLILFIKIIVPYTANHMQHIIQTQLLGKKAEFLTGYDKQHTW